jgi:alpha-galactosidase
VEDNYTLFLVYKNAAGVTETGGFDGTESYSTEFSQTDNSIKLKLIPNEKIELISLRLVRDFDYGENAAYFSNGYQSWTTSREYKKDDKLKGNCALIKYFPVKSAKELAFASGDYFFNKYPARKGEFRSYTYTYIRNGENYRLFGSLSEAEAFTFFESDINGGKLTICKDVEGAVYDSPVTLCDIVFYGGSEDFVFDSYFDLMLKDKPRRAERLTGYTSWYNYFQKITEEIILRDLEGLARVKNGANIFQIDDGYEPFVGDWLDPCDKFPRGMKPIADAIHEKGYLAGIWLAPFSAQKTSRVAKEHPDWLVKGKNGKPVTNSVAWGGAYSLNLDIPEVVEYIRKVFHDVFQVWGFDMVKLDFLYGACMFPRGGKSRGKLITEAYRLLRECAGEKLILGCGAPLGPAFVYFDACRISCDVDVQYKPRFYNKILVAREIICTQNAMNNGVFRRQLDGRAFLNDPDVFFLRDVKRQIPGDKNKPLSYTEEQKKTLAKINSLAGSVLFVSDDIGQYSEETLAKLKSIYDSKNDKIISAGYEGDVLNIVYTESGERKTLSVKNLCLS